MNLFKLSGFLSVALGMVSCILLARPSLLIFSLLSAIIGFTFATINIYLNAKYEITKGTFSIGYIGMILASFPVIFLLVLIVKGN